MRTMSRARRVTALAALALAALMAPAWPAAGQT
jgi:hypothetical protein